MSKPQTNIDGQLLESDYITGGWGGVGGGGVTNGKGPKTQTE